MAIAFSTIFPVTNFLISKKCKDLINICAPCSLAPSKSYLLADPINNISKLYIICKEIHVYCYETWASRRIFKFYYFKITF